jgi:uncharacterized membrane protein YqjE
MKWLELLDQLGLHPLQMLMNGVAQLKAQLLRSLLLVALAAICGALMLVLAAMTMLLMFWDNYRYVTLLALMATFGVMGWTFAWQAKNGGRSVRMDGVHRRSQETRCDGCVCKKR